MQELRGNIKQVDLLPIQIITSTATGTGSAVDMTPSGGDRFDAMLVKVAIGNIAGDVAPTSVKVKIQESDSSTFGSGVTTAEGGDEVTVSADTVYTFQVKRAKRYTRVIATVTGGTNPTVEIHVSAILCNWAKPFPLL